MSRPCAESAAVGAELLATVAVAVTALRQHLTDPDPKTALRAVAELTKLLGVCARHGIAVEAAAEVDVVPPPVPVPAAADSADVLGSLRERSSFADQEPLAERAERAERAEHGMPLPGGRGSQGQMPPGGKRLTSFLGSSAAKQEAG